MKFLAAAVQMLAGDDKAANLAEAERWIRAAVARGAQVVALPEVFLWRGDKKRERESDTRAFGDGIVVAQTGLCDMGLSVCYDLRFPELYRALVAKGARLIF